MEIMSAKQSFRCKECHYTTDKWQVKCPACGKRNTLEDTKGTPSDKTGAQEDKFMLLYLVIIPLGVLGLAWMWTKHGFGYGLMTALIFGVLAYFTFFSKK